MEHKPQQGGVHLETRFVQPVGHNSKDVLDKRKKVLLIKSLRHIRSSSDVLQELVENLQSLKKATVSGVNRQMGLSPIFESVIQDASLTVSEMLRSVCFMAQTTECTTNF